MESLSIGSATETVSPVVLKERFLRRSGISLRRTAFEKTPTMHKFKLGQRVRRAQSSALDERLGFGAVSEIVRLMPDDPTGEPSYRIRSGSAERAVRESEIVAAA